MSQDVVIVSYYLGRRKRSSSDGFTYEVRVVAVVRPEAAVPVPSQRVDRPLDSAEELGKRLQEAIDLALADDVEGLVWKADDLPESQLDGFIASLPDRLQALTVQPLDALAGEIGMPDAAASLTSQVAGDMLLEPVLKPVEAAVHGLELIGAIIALLTGVHGLFITCVDHLLHDELKETMAKALGRMITGSAAAPEGQPSAAAVPEATNGVTEAAPGPRPARRRLRFSGSALGMPETDQRGPEPPSPRRRRSKAEARKAEAMTRVGDGENRHTPPIAAGMELPGDDPAAGQRETPPRTQKPRREGPGLSRGRLPAGRCAVAGM